MNVNIQQYTKLVPANQVVTVSATGTYLLLYSSTGAFQFSIDGGPWQAGLCILGINIADDPTNTKLEPFTNVLLKDVSGGNNIINLFVASSPITYFEALQFILAQNAATYNKATGPLALVDGGSSAVYTGADANGNARKTFIVTNLGNNNLVLQDGSGNEAAVILANKVPLAFESSGAFIVNNPAGSGAGSYCVLEIFY